MAGSGMAQKRHLKSTDSILFGKLYCAWDAAQRRPAARRPNSENIRPVQGRIREKQRNGRPAGGSRAVQPSKGRESSGGPAPFKAGQAPARIPCAAGRKARCPPPKSVRGRAAEPKPAPCGPSYQPSFLMAERKASTKPSRSTLNSTLVFWLTWRPVSLVM